MRDDDLVYSFLIKSVSFCFKPTVRDDDYTKYRVKSVIALSFKPTVRDDDKILNAWINGAKDVF